MRRKLRQFHFKTEITYAVFLVEEKGNVEGADFMVGGAVGYLAKWTVALAVDGDIADITPKKKKQKTQSGTKESLHPCIFLSRKWRFVSCASLQRIL